jgi:hypothetical protein
MPGYVPPAVDLAMFRAGTIWHYQNAAYLVTSCSFGDRVGQRITRTIAGKPVLVKVGPADRIEVRLSLERADWADHLPPARLLDGYDQLPGPCYLFADPGLCWQVATFDVVALAPSLMYALYRPDDPPALLEVTFARRPDKDTAT